MDAASWVALYAISGRIIVVFKPLVLQLTMLLTWNVLLLLWKLIQLWTLMNQFVSITMSQILKVLYKTSLQMQMNPFHDGVLVEKAANSSFTLWEMDWICHSSATTCSACWLRELLNYRRVQAAFNKANATCWLSHKSSHFKYSLSHSIPDPNDTRWNSHLRLHEHILKHCESINKALEDNQKLNLILTTADKQNFSSVVINNVIFCWSNRYTITSNCVIVAVDSLENALKSASRDSPIVNALCRALQNSLE